ncbi:MAG: MFS transporter [Chloroflexota bacterium]
MRRPEDNELMSYTPKRQGIYYGWYVVIAALFIGFTTVGARNAFGIFVIPMSEEFGWSRSTVSIAAALGVLVNGVSAPFMGGIFDRTGGRRLILITVLVIGGATILLSLTFHILFLVFMFGVVASLAMSGPSLSNTGALMARWFRRRRTTAIGINAAALSLGGLVMVPFAMYLLQATNWRIAWVGLGMVVLTSLPLAFLFIHESPAKRGLQPDGDPEPLKKDSGQPAPIRAGPLEVSRWADSFRSAPIWQMSAAYFVCGTTTFILAVHFVPFALDRGVSPGMAATIFGFMMGLNILGSLGAGFLADRLGGTKNWLALVYLMRGVAYVLLLTIPSTAGLWAFATVAGFSWVATAPLTTTLTADVYGLRALGTISGVSFLFHQVGGFCSVLLAGILYDVTGSYTLPFAIAGSLLFPAAISAFTIKERKYSVRYQVQATPAAAAGD